MYESDPTTLKNLAPAELEKELMSRSPIILGCNAIKACGEEPSYVIMTDAEIAEAREARLASSVVASE